MRRELRGGALSIALVLIACGSPAGTGTDGGTGGPPDSGGTPGTDGGKPRDAGTGSGVTATFPEHASGGPNAYNVSLAFDSSGGVHMAYMMANGSPLMARYGYCAGNCGQAGGWAFTDVVSAGLALGAISVAVDSGGRPRIVFTDSGNGLFIYAECNGNCLSQASWSSGTVATYHANVFDQSGNRFLGIDPQGHPHFVYWDQSGSHTGTYYRACNAGNCTQSASWTEVALSPSPYLDRFTLLFDAQGRPRLAYEEMETQTGNGYQFASYAECNSGCDQASGNWSGTFVQQISAGYDLTFALDSTGNPHLAMYAGTLPAQPDGGAPPTSDQLVYMTCAGGCATGSNWTGRTMGLPAGDGEGGVSIGFAGGLPVITYLEGGANPFGAGRLQCVESPCENASTPWTGADIDTSDAMDTDWPIPPPANCTVAHWFPGDRMGMVSDAQGHFTVAYDAQHHAAGGACNPVQTDNYAIRVLAF